METETDAFLRQISDPATLNDADIEQDFRAMLKRGRDRRIGKAQAAEALHGKPYPPSRKFVQKVPDGSTRSWIKLYHLHGFKKHARDHMADHNVIPPLYAEQDMVEEVITECMSNGQKRYIV